MPCSCDPVKKSRGECCCKGSVNASTKNSEQPLCSTKVQRNTTCGSSTSCHSTPRKSGRSTIPVNKYFPDVSTIVKKDDEGDSKKTITSPANRKGCVSLEPRKKPPCAKTVTQQAPRFVCPAKQPEPPSTPPPCAREDVAKEKKPLKKRPAKSQNQCKPERSIESPCGTSSTEEQRTSGRLPAQIFALEKTLSKTRWQDEEGYHSASVTMSQLYRPDDQLGNSMTKCAGEKRRNYLRTKLSELLGESRPIPEGDIPDGGEVKPEPEVVAAALLMSDGESTDLGKVRPGNVFDQLFSTSSPSRAVALASAAPKFMSNVVVPMSVQGRKPPSLDVPNIHLITQKARGIATPNPSAFQESSIFATFPEHRNNIMTRTPTEPNVSQYVGVVDTITTENLNDSFTDKWDGGIVEYVIKPRAPSYRNLMQLNGSVRPSWFPGYVVVSPSVPDCVRLSPDAGEALNDAWCLCRPQNFDDRSKALVTTN